MPRRIIASARPDNLWLVPQFRFRNLRPCRSVSTRHRQVATPACKNHMVCTEQTERAAVQL
jgi:hypothetical protein